MNLSVSNQKCQQIIVESVINALYRNDENWRRGSSIQISDLINFPFLYLSNYIVDNNQMVALRSEKYFHY